MAERSGVIGSRSRVRLGLASDEWLVGVVRRGDTAAFEALYDRHARELLRFCVYMLGSRQDAEDAVQATFASAYRALRADGRPISLRPWLFTIARNECLTMLRRRRPIVELTGDVATRSGPADHLELNEELRRVFEGLRNLPETQRAALVLAEVHGLSHREVGRVLGVRTEQVKAFVYQARSRLVSERAARDADCREIREELASARGAALLRGRLRRHVRSCPDCRSYADGVARQRRQLGALLPLVPSLALKYRALEQALNLGRTDPASAAGGAAGGAAAGVTIAGTAAEVAGSSAGAGALVCKIAAGVACLGASAGIGVSVLGSPEGGSLRTATIAASAEPLLASAGAPRARASVTGPYAAPTAAGASDFGGDSLKVSTVVAPVRSSGSPAPSTPGGEIRVRDYASAEAGEARGTAGETEAPPAAASETRPAVPGERSSDGERRVVAEQRSTRRDGHKQYVEEQARQREQRQAERAVRHEEERKRELEEMAQRRAEREQEAVGHSRVPPTEEELLAKKQRNEQKREERRQEREP